jgi:hypothetical protein
VEGTQVDELSIGCCLMCLKKYGWMGYEVIVTNCGLTEEHTRDRGMWVYLVLGEGRPLYSGQPLDEGVKLCTLYSQCSSGVQIVPACHLHLRLTLFMVGIVASIVTVYRDLHLNVTFTAGSQELTSSCCE